MAYKGFTDAQARAHRKYMENTATITLTLSKEERDAIKERAVAVGAPSVNRYILGLVRADLGNAAGD